MSDGKDQPGLEQVDSDMAKVGPSFHHKHHQGQLMSILGFPRAVQVCLPGNSSSITILVVSDVSTRGEKTASALESRLTDIESRIEQLLASIEDKERNEHDSLADEPADRQSVTTSRK
jgi:hypothetical protein